MERYTNFEKLKKRTTSSSTNSHISTTMEHKITRFIDLLKASVVSTQNTTDKPTLNNSQKNSPTYGR
jgi:hypothetical protein